MKCVLKYVDALEMCFYRRIMRTLWTDKKRNKDVLREGSSERELVAGIRRKQSAFFWQAMRREKLKCLMLTRKLEGKRDSFGIPQDEENWNM